MISAPAGASIETSRSWSLPLTLIAVRLVVITPVIVVASTLAMLRSIRWSGSVADGDEVVVRLVEDERRVDRAVGADRAGAHVERRRPA